MILEKTSQYIISGSFNDRMVSQVLHKKRLSVGISVEDAKEIVDNKNVDLAVLEKHFYNKDVLFEGVKPLDRYVKIGGIYRHFKGETVTVFCIATHTEFTNENFVIYSCSNGFYARPLEMFLSEVDHEKYPDVKQKYRFELIGEVEDDA